MKDLIFNLKVQEKLHFQEMVMEEQHLGPMLREYIISEAMHALNIPTTRSLAVVKTGEVVVKRKYFTRSYTYKSCQ